MVNKAQRPSYCPKTACLSRKKEEDARGAEDLVILSVLK